MKWKPPIQKSGHTSIILRSFNSNIRNISSVRSYTAQSSLDNFQKKSKNMSHSYSNISPSLITNFNSLSSLKFTFHNPIWFWNSSTYLVLTSNPDPIRPILPNPPSSRPRGISTTLPVELPSCHRYAHTPVWNDDSRSLFCYSLRFLSLYFSPENPRARHSPYGSVPTGHRNWWYFSLTIIASSKCTSMKTSQDSGIQPHHLTPTATLVYYYFIVDFYGIHAYST